MTTRRMGWLAVVLACLVSTVGAGAEQTRYAGTAASYPWGWANPSAAKGEPDNACATVGLPNKEIALTDFGFSIPADATITGVRVEVKGGRDCGGFLFAALSTGMAPLGIAKALAMPSVLTCNATAFVSAGGDGDLWGVASLTPAQVNSSSFGVLVGSGYEVSLRMVDSVRVTVYYVVKYTVTVTANPAGAGTVTGEGVYDPGQSVTVKATPASGYSFVNWTEGASVVSTSQTYSFTINANRTLVANFSDRPCVAVNANPPGGGTVAGAGCYPRGTSVTVTATPASGYSFVNWTEGTSVVSTSQTYSFTLTASRALVANFRQTPACILYEDFEDITGWTRTGLWHVRDMAQTPCFTCTGITGKFAYYARPAPACDYATPTRTVGYLTSPSIPITGYARLELRFDFYRHVESYAAAVRDRTYVQVSLGGRAWRTVWTRDSRNASPECNAASVVFDTGGASTLRIRLVFDSVNSLNNAFRGWAVDNVCVRPAGAEQRPAALPIEEPGQDETGGVTSGIVVSNSPNPVRDVHTTTFTVRGVQADGLRVEVFDLAGKLVWKAESGGTDIVWHTEDLTGLPLANGVYLYTVQVRVAGQWITLGPQKLVILR